MGYQQDDDECDKETSSHTSSSLLSLRISLFGGRREQQASHLTTVHWLFRAFLVAAESRSHTFQAVELAVDVHLALERLAGASDESDRLLEQRPPARPSLRHRLHRHHRHLLLVFCCRVHVGHPSVCRSSGSGYETRTGRRFVSCSKWRTAGRADGNE